MVLGENDSAAETQLELPDDPSQDIFISRQFCLLSIHTEQIWVQLKDTAAWLAGGGPGRGKEMLPGWNRGL